MRKLLFILCAVALCACQETKIKNITITTYEAKEAFGEVQQVGKPKETIFIELDKRGNFTKHQFLREDKEIFNLSYTLEYKGDKIVKRVASDGSTTVNKYEGDKIKESTSEYEGSLYVTKYEYEGDRIKKEIGTKDGVDPLTLTYAYNGDTTFVSQWNTTGDKVEVETCMVNNKVIKIVEAGKYGNITSIVEWDNDVPVRCVECWADEHNYITSSGYRSDCEHLYSYEFDPQGNWTKRA